MDYPPAARHWREKYPGSAGAAYMEARGIDGETTARFGLGYNEEARRIIIPCGGAFIARAIDSERVPKYLFAKGFRRGIYPDNWADFVAAAHEQRKPAPVFVVEDEIDAMSISAATGGKVRAVAFDGVSGIMRFVEGLKAVRDDSARLSPIIVVPLENGLSLIL